MGHARKSVIPKDTRARGSWRARSFVIQSSKHAVTLGDKIRLDRKETEMQTFSFTGVSGKNQMSTYYISRNRILCWKQYKTFQSIVAPVLAETLRHPTRVVVACENSSGSLVALEAAGRRSLERGHGREPQCLCPSTHACTLSPSLPSLLLLLPPSLLFFHSLFFIKLDEIVASMDLLPVSS